MGGSERLGWCFCFILQEGMPECVQARSLQLHVVAEKLIAVCGQVDCACEGYVVVAKVLQPFWMVG
jgi:hypothetical protein